MSGDDKAGQAKHEFGHGGAAVERVPTVTPSGPAPRFPYLVVLAGIIWVLYGSLILFGVVVFVVVHISEGMSPELVELLGPGLIWAAFGGVLLLVGVRTVRRVAQDTLRNGIA